MAKGKSRAKAKARNRQQSPEKKTCGRKPLLVFIFMVVIAAVMWWQWPAIVSWADANIGQRALVFFDWGLIIFFVAIIALGWLVWRRKLSTLFRHWNRWLGAIALTLSLWGILAFAAMGGSFGLGIIGGPDAVGVLRILGLVALGIIFIAPGWSFRQIGRFIAWIGQLLKRKPSTKPVKTLDYRQAAHKEAPAAAEHEPAMPPTAPGPPELKQVAQEVWRKYGEVPSLVTVDGWRLPPIDILEKAPEAEFSQADSVQRARLIEQALTSYGVEAKVVQINPGPTVTQFGVEPGWDRKIKEIKERDRDGNVQIRTEEVSKTRVKVERITSLANDLALTLSAPTLRIEAPVPGKPVIGIEVPNTTSSLVTLRGVIETSNFQKIAARSHIALALGTGAGGESVVADLSRMPHLLIAGATGSGKTVCLNSIICCLLFHNPPTLARFIMIDPKRVELTPFNSIPHLATPVIVDTKKALTTLRWLNQEMDKRYQKLASTGARNIENYNKNRQGEEKLPYLVLIIDELADLMMTGFDEVEHILCRLAQLARATGIHLVVATQRPSVDVITGLIKANFPTRISFAVTSQVDSRTILDGAGAEKLLGRGDMLYMPTEAAKPKRLQGCLVSDAEIERLVYFWGTQKRDTASQLRVEDMVPPAAAIAGKEYPKDALLEAAKDLASEHKRVSTSFLQRKLHIGYPRAARLMEQLEESMKEESGEGES